MIVSVPGQAFVSITAARSVHTAAAVRHWPSPGAASGTSAALFTVTVRAVAPGVGVGVVVRVAVGVWVRVGLLVGVPVGVCVGVGVAVGRSSPTNAAPN